MHIRALITLAIALIMGGLTVFLINHYLQEEVTNRAASKVISTQPVVVAATDLKYGDKLDKLQLKIVQWPSAYVPKDSYSSIDAVIGKEPPVVLTQIQSGEPVLPYKLSPHGARGGLPAKIPEDKRAVTIAVNEVSGVAGFIMPGDYVDILHTTNAGRSDKQLITTNILQNVQVLGIDQIYSEENDKPRVVNAVTLLVTLYDAQRLVLAQSLGELNLALRNEFDASILEESTVSIKELSTAEPEREVKVTKRVRRPRPEPTVIKENVEVIRGLEITNQKFNKPKEGATPEQTPEKQPTAGSAPKTEQKKP